MHITLKVEFKKYQYFMESNYIIYLNVMQIINIIHMGAGYQDAEVLCTP